MTITDWDPARHPRAYATAATGRKWDAGKHARWPAGTPGGLGGKFRNAASAAKLSKLTGVPAAELLKDPSKAVPGRAARKGARPTAPPLPEIADPNSPDAIDVHGDVRLAAKLLGEGKHVRLQQVREVSVLLDHLAMLVKDAEEKGEKAPDYDLCRVSVKGQNLFCVESKGIPRVKMPQLAGIPQPGTKADAMEKNKKGEVDLTPGFVALLKRKGYSVKEAKEHAAYLRPSQNELNGQKVAGMVKWMRGGGDPNSNSQLMISDDNYIIDGHHRWAATVALDSEDGRLGNDKQIPVLRVGISTIELLAEAVKYANEQGIANAGFGSEPVLPAGKKP